VSFNHSISFDASKRGRIDAKASIGVRAYAKSDRFFGRHIDFGLDHAAAAGIVGQCTDDVIADREDNDASAFTLKKQTGRENARGRHGNRLTDGDGLCRASGKRESKTWGESFHDTLHYQSPSSFQSLPGQGW
jgi:hypothetical protein